MKLYGQIENAQLENKASDYSVGPVGRIWWNTATTQARVDDGTNIRALLRNDGFCVLGSSGTASTNIRFHRGGTGLLQLVSGADTTAEGTPSTALNKISAKLESYTTGTLPANGNVGRTVWDTTVSTLKVDDGAAWITMSTVIQPNSTIYAPQGVGTAFATDAAHNKIRVFRGTTVISGTDITYATSNANGDTFTINTAGVYYMSYSDDKAAGAANHGISLNSANLSTSIVSLSTTERLTATTAASSVVAQCSVAVRLAVNDVIRGHADGTQDENGAFAGFRITRISG